MLVTALRPLNPFSCITPASGIINDFIVFLKHARLESRTLYFQKFSRHLRVGRVNLKSKVFTIGLLGLISIIETDGGIFACLILGLILISLPVRICMLLPLVHNRFEGQKYPKQLYYEYLRERKTFYILMIQSKEKHLLQFKMRNCENRNKTTPSHHTTPFHIQVGGFELTLAQSFDNCTHFIFIRLCNQTTCTANT